MDPFSLGFTNSSSNKFTGFLSPNTKMTLAFDRSSIMKIREVADVKLETFWEYRQFLASNNANVDEKADTDKEQKSASKAEKTEVKAEDKKDDEKTELKAETPEKKDV